MKTRIAQVESAGLEIQRSEVRIPVLVQVFLLRSYNEYFCALLLLKNMKSGKSLSPGMRPYHLHLRSYLSVFKNFTSVYGQMNLNSAIT